MENIKNIAMRIRYDGTNYHGWQSQSNGVTVQSTIEKALSELTGSDVKVTGCREPTPAYMLWIIFLILNQKQKSRWKNCRTR